MNTVRVNGQSRILTPAAPEVSRPSLLATGSFGILRAVRELWGRLQPAAGFSPPSSFTSAPREAA